MLTLEEQQRLFKTAEDNTEWEHVYNAGILSANPSCGVEVKHVRRKDFDSAKRVIHIRTSKNETSKRVIPLNESAFEAVETAPAMFRTEHLPGELRRTAGLHERSATARTLRDCRRLPPRPM